MEELGKLSGKGGGAGTTPANVNESSARSGVMIGESRGPIRLVLDPTFGLFFMGRLLAGTGVWVHSVVAAILAYELTESALVVGVVSAAQFLPQLLLAPWSGARVDRGNRTQQIIAGWLLSAIGSAGMSVVIVAFGAENVPGPAPLIAASLLAGLGFVLSGPAMQAAVPSLVRPDELPTAMALNSVPLTISRAGGPMLGALVAASAGPGLAFALAAATSVAFAVVVRLMSLPAQAPVSQGADSSVAAALRHVRRDRPLLLLLIGVAAVGLAGDPAITLAPSISDELTSGQDLVGPIAGIFGLGTGLGFLVLTALRSGSRSPWVGTAGLLLVAAGLTCAGATSVVWVVLAGFAMGGLGTSLALTSMTTQLQERVSENLRGRLMALWLVGFIGSRPLAGAVNGVVTDATSAATALFLTASVVAGAAMLCRPSRLAALPQR